MYASPIEKIYKDMEIRINQEVEETIIKAVKECDIEVDKEELIKALKYDRDQYRKGYNDALDKIRAEIDKIYEREGNSFDCLNALDELKWFIDKYRAESDGKTE